MAFHAADPCHHRLRPGLAGNSTEEGGLSGRGARYRENGRILIEGMRALGFKTLLADEVQAPIIVTFHMPADPHFDFAVFYEALRERGYVIYPGKSLRWPSRSRIGLYRPPGGGSR